MNIGVNTTGVSATGAGGSTYTRELLAGLRRVAPEDTITEFAFRARFSRNRRILRTVDTLAHQTAWLQYHLPRKIRSASLDLFHNPAAIIPLRCPIPLVVTLHDLYIFRNPAAFRYWHQASTRFFTRQSLERADRIIAISEFTRREISDVLGPRHDAKISVIHEAAHPRFGEIPDDRQAEIARKHRLEKPYVLCVSTIEPRKNLEATVQAFARIRDRIDHELVIVGGMGWKQERIRDRVAGLGLEPRVRFLGYVDLEDLPALYARAELFAYPSRYEGFGLPILEAMGCGCPVLTSNRASMPEIAGAAAVLVDPDDIDEIAGRMEAVLLDEARRETLSRAGRERAVHFSWDRCARETRAVYQSLL